jgi:hypothetical protein
MLLPTAIPELIYIKKDSEVGNASTLRPHALL